ncbi:Cohesin subunit psc3 [Hypsizygus marmoreus]|uniref:Cohesin subunit psc3 n=1 Tax=Hypsizygus marmoreus TaxID=39966 RepID=A0A369JUY5_HYPMA|nr:Cohesin subunit psc3 [Hypsizygus marmoreus]
MASESPANSPAPRRSQREKKVVKPFASVVSRPSKGKRKRHESDAEEEEPAEPAQEDVQGSPDDEADDEGEEEEDYRAPKPKTSSHKAPTKTAPKAKGQPPAKKARVAKPSGSKPTKPIATRKGRKAKEGEDAYDAAQVAKDTKITADNPLFNAVMNPSAALQSTAEDFLESLEQTPGAALAELINLILRACGCNDSVDSDEVLDYDGVVDALDNFTEGLKKDNSPVYPLTSKLPVFKKFRRSLSEFIERLIASSADLGALYTSDLMETLQTWVIAMSSSQIRSFRHTATVVALEVETALCDVAAAVEKEAEVVGRQREGEKKRKVSNKGGGARDKELEAKAQEIRERRTKLAEFLKEFVDGVFVHRYRDLDPNIRAECVHAIGLWFKKYPGHFLDAAYLRYVGWVLSDSNTHVRLEAVKSLSGVYEQAEYIGSLNHFTERFKPRLIEMATKDTELPVRVAVIQVLGAIDGHSLLEDEEREKLCLLVFDEEAKVRKAVSQFVKGVWDECVDERLVGKNKPSEEDRRRAGIKALAMLLVKWGKSLDKIAGDAGDADSAGGDQEDEEGDGTSHRSKRREVVALVAMEQKGRTALAVEALWDEVDTVRDWEGLLDLLLLDHSDAEAEESQEGGSRKGRGRVNGKTHTPDSAVDEAWRLEEVEESILLEVLVASIRRAKWEAAASKKGEDETVTNDITRELIKGLPRLFIKHQTDQNRIADVLLIPTLMNLDLYLEMRMITSYSSLWDDVTKQFLSHSSLNVLTHAMAAIRHFMDANSLSNANSTKILELEDELSSVLRDTVAGRDEIEVASFSEDEVLSLSALCTRLAVLFGTRNMTAWMDEDEGGKQSSAWDIISALVERGRLGYKEEETMIEQALHVLTLHIIWKSKSLANDVDPSPEETRFKEVLVSQRESLLEKLVEYAVGTQSNTVDNVKRAAFKNLLDLHVLFTAGQTVDADGAPLPIASVALSLDDEVQYRCAGYIQAEIERYADTLDNGTDEADAEAKDSDEDSSNEEREDDASAEKRRKGQQGRKSPADVDITSRSHLEQEYLFIDVMSTFLRAIRAGAIHIRHGAILLAHYGRLGAAFDQCSKVVVDVLREEGMMNDHGEVVVSVITQALREAYTLVLDGVVHDESYSLQLSKLLATCFVIRGSQLSVIRRLDSKYVVQVHTELLSWIAKRIAAYESNKNKKSLKVAVLFFKVLLPLIGTIQSRDALRIKAHMDQVLAQAKVEVSPTSKVWEPQRLYEKRLTAALSKEKGPTGGRKGRGKTAKGATTDEEATDGEGLTDDQSKEPPRPKPRRSHRTNPVETQDDLEQTGDEEHPEPATPKARIRPRPIQKKEKSPAPSSPQAVESEPPARSPARGDVDEQPITNGVETPKPSRKRARPDDDDETQSNLGDVSPDGAASDSHAPQATPPPPGDGEIQIRRKRVRH